MAEMIDIEDAEARFSELVDRAAKGEGIIIARDGRPMVRLVALKTEAPRRKPGLLKGKIWIGDDFDDPLPGDVFEGDDDL